MNNYKAGSSYAYKLFGPWVYRDVLHDIYVNHHKKTGKNIFTDCTPVFLFQAIRWRRNDEWRAYRTGARGSNPVPRMVACDEFLDTGEFDFEQQDMVNYIVGRIKRTTAENATPEVTLQILSYLLKGYKIKDIVKETGRSSQSIDYHVKKIRTLWTCAIKPGNSCLKKTLT